MNKQQSSPHEVVEIFVASHDGIYCHVIVFALEMGVGSLDFASVEM